MNSARRAHAAERQRDQLGEAEADGHQDDHAISTSRAIPLTWQAPRRRAAERSGPSDGAVAAGPGSASWPSFSMASLSSTRTALGERRRGLHHLAEGGALLRTTAGQGLVEEGAGRLGVVALGRAGAEDRLGCHAVFDSLWSCSSVRFSSCGIAASAPTCICIFTCFCLATGDQCARRRSVSGVESSRKRVWRRA